MFARKGKNSDQEHSIQRFSDMNRDSVSRVKHLKILLDQMNIQEKRQLIDEFSFETFHLVDELLLTTDIASNPQGAIEAESGLWTLEQVLCLAPEQVGSGWQRHAIESLLKKAIYPRNLLAVRKIAIRLFLIFYQSLSVFDKVTPDLDRVFQCLLPYFPLRNGDSTELVLQEYCQSAGSVQWSNNVKCSSPNLAGTTAKERAQELQIYLDKFLEYCSRESTRIEWSEESRRVHCAKFMVDRLTNLYIGECFADLETNGVDVFGGWEGAEDVAEALDTSDPVVIARYWLIRWINNVVGARQQSPGSVHAGLLLFHEALFSSQKATNTALTLMREAMSLPLPCSNVIHKVVQTLSNWLLQYEIPPFVGSGEVTMESASLLVTSILLSFFHSPYLPQPGDRLSSALSISFSILRSCRDLVASRMQLPRPLTVRVWSELISRLSEAALRVCSMTEKYAQETCGAFASTLLTSFVIIRAVRRVELDDKLWDLVHSVFQHGFWIQMAQQWATIVRSVNRALILHVAHVDIFTKEELDRSAKGAVLSRRERDSGGTDIPEEPSFQEADDITQAVASWSGDATTWLLVWRRVISLLGPQSNSSALIAVQAISTTVHQLMMVGLDSLAWSQASRLVTAPAPVLGHCVGALAAVLNGPCPPPPLLQAHILHAFRRLLVTSDPQVLPYLLTMSPLHVAVVAPPFLEQLPQQISPEPSQHILKAVALLSSQHFAAEQFVLKQLSAADLTLSHSLMCLNAMTILIVQRADHELMHKLVDVLRQHRFAPRLLPVLCFSLPVLAKFGHGSSVLLALLRAASTLGDERSRAEISWAMTSLCLESSQKETGQVLKGILGDHHALLEGLLVTMAGQFPLPGFGVSKWNCGETVSQREKANDNTAFVHRKSGVISVSKEAECEVTCRTVVGRHVWQLEPHCAQKREGRNVGSWLRREAAKGRKAGRAPAGILGAMDDPFDALPRVNNNKPSVVETAPWIDILENSRRQPQPLRTPDKEPPRVPTPRLLEWRSFAASLGFVPSVAEVPPNFNRDLKHLDQTSSREVHKVAVIFVGNGQEEKQSILSNTSASPQFDLFVKELGWEVRIGPSHEGYTGGLPVDTVAPYFASPDTEVIFHVSTKLGGDVTQKWKHIGNDEVHVVWSEHNRPYRRETMATKFCDVLIVLEQAGNNMCRVRVETTSSLEFGPLFDGALVGEPELAELVRLTVVNASRAYRLAREDHARPLRHREHVFSQDTKRHMKPVHLADAINNLYVPSIMAGGC